MTTTPSIEGARITSYVALVTGEAIIGANIFKDLFASITDIVSGRAGNYEKELGKARHMACEEMESAALHLGANAIVGVHLNYEVLGGGMLMVAISGTAVITDNG